MVVEDRKPVSMEALASYPAFDLCQDIQINHLSSIY